ncbi:MAG: helix-turn-helix domain-containing protein [Clostridia bacterium]|nr:helix-turn-helix domain-containing protein [Oscillospiraceae bacterium]MBQ2750003.1 helix-turn-helix domain-containing protein [Clostridia bacterium]
MEDENRLQLENLICNIVFLRKHFGISRKRMAKLLGIGVTTLQKLEQGILPPRLGVDIFFHIQRNFGIAPVTILTRRLEEEEK